METDIITTEITETTETTTVATVMPLADMVGAAETALEAVKTAQLAYEAQLQQIAEAHGNTYQHSGQWFQIRSRESAVEKRKITYLCELKDEPKTWLKGPRKKTAAVAATSTQEEAPMMGLAVQTTVEGITTTVID